MNNVVEFKNLRVGDLFVFGHLIKLMMKIENTPHGETNTVILSGEERGELLYIHPGTVVDLIERKM